MHPQQSLTWISQIKCSVINPSLDFSLWCYLLDKLLSVAISQNMHHFVWLNNSMKWLWLFLKVYSKILLSSQMKQLTVCFYYTVNFIPAITKVWCIRRFSYSQPEVLLWEGYEPHGAPNYSSLSHVCTSGNATDINQCHCRLIKRLQPTEVIAVPMGSMVSHRLHTGSVINLSRESPCRYLHIFEAIQSNTHSCD